MDSGLTIRPSDSAAHAAVARPAPTPATRAVATELAPSKAVTAADNAARVRNDSRQVADQEPATRIDISFDKKTHVAVYKIIDTQTGHVILQVPQQARADLTVHRRRPFSFGIVRTPETACASTSTLAHAMPHRTFDDRRALGNHRRSKNRRLTLDTRLGR